MWVKSRNIIIITFLVSFQVFAQNIAIGQWRDHLAYNEGTDVAIAGKRIYCIANENLYYYDSETNEIVRQSKTVGFSDVNATAIDYDNATQTLFIGYKNANIDIIKNGEITNMPDVYRKQTVGNKTINNVKFYNSLAYVSTGLGIVVIDPKKLEVKDTYSIDTVLVSVNEVAFDNENIYAATSSGLYKAPKNSNYLSAFSVWKKMTYYPNKSITSLAVFNDSLIANFNETNINHTQIYDRINDVWLPYKADYPYTLNSLTDGGEQLIACYDGVTTLIDKNRNFTKIINNYYSPRQSKAVQDNEGNIWIADKVNSLVKIIANTDKFEYIKPKGPYNNKSSQLRTSANSIWVAPGGAQTGNNSYDLCNLSIFKDNEWKFIESDKFSNAAGTYNFWDAMCIAPNPNDENSGFVGSYGRGVAEVSNDSVLNIFRQGNSAIQFVTCCDFARIGGLDYDASGNLWIANGEVSNFLVVYTTDKNWYNFPLRSLNSPQLHGLIVSKSQKQWMISERNGVIGYDNAGTIENTKDDVEKLIVFEKGKGSIPGTGVYSIAEDMNGDIWIGSDKGISVLYSPDNVFGGTNVEAQQIKIDQDGYIGYLLESEKVTCITVDDANRKWIGTESNGIFFISADGTKQLEHFNIENSPLISNSVFSIAINHLTGEIFISTEKGIMSYKSTATLGFVAECQDVIAYPNPVKLNYTGVIAIRGLLQKSNVNITDVAGNLVYKTTTYGGQATWDGKNMKGDKAKPGVYFVLTSNDDATAGCSTKIVLMK